MILTGYCAVQKQECTISVEELNAGNLQNPNKTLYGRITCPHVKSGDECNIDCTILKQHGIKK